MKVLKPGKFTDGYGRGFIRGRSRNFRKEWLGHLPAI